MAAATLGSAGFSVPGPADAFTPWLVRQLRNAASAPLAPRAPKLGRSEAQAATALSQVDWSTLDGFWNIPPPPPGKPPPGPPDGRRPDGNAPGPPAAPPPPGPPPAPRDGRGMVTPRCCRQPGEAWHEVPPPA